MKVSASNLAVIPEFQELTTMVLVRVWSTDKSRKKLLNITDGDDLKRQAIAKGLAR